MTPDLERIGPLADAEFSLRDRVSSHTINITFGSFRFPEPGVYWVEISLDGEREAAFPLPVFAQGTAEEGRISQLRS